MKLPVEHKIARAALALAVSGLALGVGGFGASSAMAGLKIPFVSANKQLPPAPAVPQLPRALSGPAADYPVVLGDAYRVGDRVFTPVNAMNYDAVGYAAVGGPDSGVSAAHHTLPLPSYIEVTSLASGRTILVRVDRRGPMDSTHAVELSPAAAAQLGISGDGRAAVRVRRVNPLETERAALRAGSTAPERMITPKPLLAVLQRRMATDPAAGHAGALLSSSLMVSAPKDDEDDDAPVKPLRAPALAAKATKAAAPKFAAIRPAGVPPVAGANFSAEPAPKMEAPKLAAAKPAPKVLAPKSSEPAPYSRAAFASALGSKAKPVGKHPIALEARTSEAEEEVRPLSGSMSGGRLVVQVGAFSDKARAGSVANRAGAHLSSAGSLWRVRMGPYASRGEAEAALAKAKAAGYSEARIQRGD